MIPVCQIKWLQVEKQKATVVLCHIGLVVLCHCASLIICHYVSYYSKPSALQIEVFHKENGLSEDLLMGCRVVLKERKVVLGLMSKCETISSKMVQQVTKLMEKGMGGMKQPSLLNSQ